MYLQNLQFDDMYSQNRQYGDMYLQNRQFENMYSQNRQFDDMDLQIRYFDDISYLMMPYGDSVRNTSGYSMDRSFSIWFRQHDASVPVNGL